MFTFNDTAGHAAATVSTRQTAGARSRKLRQVEQAMAHLLTHADRQRRRTGHAPEWHPFLLSISQTNRNSSLPHPRCPVNARPSRPWWSASPGELLQLAYCAWNAELELTPTPARTPGVRQMGLTAEPRVIRPANDAAVLVGESIDRIVIAAAASSPAQTNGLEDLAGAIVESNAEGFVSDAGAPGMVNRHDLEFSRLFWSAAEPHVPPTARDLVLTGHGRAAAAVTLAALAVRANRPECGISVVTFGSPPVGDGVFRDYYDLAIPRHIRIESEDDIVPHLGMDPLLLSLIWPNQAARLRAANPALSHVGRLQYFHDGHAVDDVPERDLSRSRRFRLFSLLCSGERDTEIRDHSLAEGYLPVLSAAGSLLHDAATIKPNSSSPTANPLSRLKE